MSHLQAIQEILTPVVAAPDAVRALASEPGIGATVTLRLPATAQRSANP